MVQPQAAVNAMQVVDVLGAVRTVEATLARGWGGGFKRYCGGRCLRHPAQMPPRSRPGERIPCGSKTCFRRWAISCSAPEGGQTPSAFFISRGQRLIMGAAPEVMPRSMISQEQLSNSGNPFGPGDGKRAR